MLYYVMMDEKSVAECTTLDAARTTARTMIEGEVFPAEWWICDEGGNDVESVRNTYLEE